MAILDHRGIPFSENGSRRSYDPAATSFHPNGFADEGYGTFPLPHVATFNAIYSSGSQTYWQDRWDEAIRMARENALVMRRDAFLMSLLQERKLAVASIPWELEIPDEKDERQRVVRDTIKRAIEGIADLRRIIFALLEAVWYGRYAVEVEWEWTKIHGKKVLTIADWFPINGDKLGWNFDGIPYVLTNATVVQPRPDVELVNTTAGGRGLLLKGTWRDRFFIHRHEMDDADYFEGQSAGGVWGVGVRSRIFWMDWVRREYMEWITTFLERVGLGVTIWYYDGGNPQALNAVAAAAKNQSRRANLFVPIFSDGKGSPRGLVERIETPVNGVDALRMLKEDIEQKIERYVVGQEASSKGEGASGLGNQASAKFQWSTKDKITEWDASNLAETLTGNARNPGLVYLIQRWSFPDTMPDQPNGFRVKWKFGVEKQEADKKLAAAEKVIRLGIPVKTDEVRNAAGFTKPDVGDEVVSLQQSAPGSPSAAHSAGSVGPQQPGVVDPNADNGFEPPFPANGGEPTQEQQLSDEAGGQFMYERESGHKYSSTQLELSLGDKAARDASAAIKAMQHFVSREDLAEDGEEDCLHITVKYGLDTSDPKAIARIVAGFGKVKARLRKTSLFRTNEADVLKIDVDSECLHKLNGMLSAKLAHTDTFPTYKPHITIAYLKPGTGDRYANMSAVDGLEVSFDKLTFSDQDRFKTTFDMTQPLDAWLSEYERGRPPASNVTQEMLSRKEHTAQAPPHNAAPPGWSTYHGARGGIGWKNNATGKVIYATSGRDPFGRRIKAKSPTEPRPGIPIATPAARRRINGIALAKWYAEHWNLLAELGLQPEASEKHEAGLELWDTGAGLWFNAHGDKRWYAIQVRQPEQRSREEQLRQYAQERAPAGGINIGGQFYPGGEWIPGDVMEKATPEQKQQIDRQQSVSEGSRLARGPVDMEKMRAAVSPHAGTRMTGQQLREARMAFDSLMQAHGELLMHRIEELTQSAQKVLDTIPPGDPRAPELRQKFTERLASYARMVDWAEEHGMTPEDSTEPGEFEVIDDDVATNPTEQASDKQPSREPSVSEETGPTGESAFEPTAPKPKAATAAKLQGRISPRLKPLAEQMLGLTKDTLTPELSKKLYGPLSDLGFEDKNKVAKAIGISMDDLSKISSAVLNDEAAMQAHMLEKAKAERPDQQQPAPATTQAKEAPGKSNRTEVAGLVEAISSLPKSGGTIGSILAALKKNNPSMTEGQIHDAMRQLQASGHVEMSPYTRAMTEVAGQSPMFQGGNLMHFVRKGKNSETPSFSTRKPSITATSDVVKKMIDSLPKSGMGDKVTLESLYDQLREADPELTEGEFQDVIRELHKSGAIKLSPYTRSLAELGDNSKAFYSGGEIMRYASRAK